MPAAQPLRIGIVGAGAIGSALAGQLALAGQPVSLVARGARHDALVQHGLRLRDGGNEARTARPAIIRADGLAACELIVLAVKAQALPALLPQLARVIAPAALLMPAVNGLPWWYFQGASRYAGTRLAALDPDGTMLPLFAPERLLGCVVYTRAAMNGDGEVVVQGQQALRIGRIAPGLPPQAIGDQLSAGGIKVSVEPDVRREVWRKLLRNASTNLISGLTGATLEQIGQDPALVAIVRGIALEIAGLSARLDCAVEADLDDIVAELGRAGPHLTSTLQDIRAGRQPELDALAEAPLEAAKLVQQEMPILRHVLALLRARLRYAAA
jgi:2-dehydropantoate 2-reductase